ncbi:uncharacterized protein [Engystomops pustulosus]|uniref:uncharacterized protein n=1 Tax=Engystomops pustulosus TaxID=76066 RepID=UPI003AFB2896
MASSSKATGTKKQKKTKHTQEERMEEEPQAPAAASTPEASSSSEQQPPAAKQTSQEPPKLPPYMRDTVALRLKEVDGRVPDMTKEVFCKKMLLDQGVKASDIFGIQAMVTGLFYVTFISVNVCRRYWEAIKAAAPDSPFSNFVGNCLLQREERKITVSMWNLRTPGSDINTLLSRYCIVVKEPAKILNCYGLWMGKWTATVRLLPDPEAKDGLKHLPQSFTLGNSYGLIFYPDMPRTCRKCGQEGHVIKACKEEACKNCRVTGHVSKDCPRRTTCNLCGLAGHLYKDCPERKRTWADVAALAPAKGFEARTPAVSTPQPRKKASKNANKQSEAPKPRSGKTKKVTPSTTQPSLTSHNPPSPLSPAEIAIPPLASISEILSPAPRATLPPQSIPTSFGEAALMTSSPATSPLAMTETNFPYLSQALVSNPVSPEPSRRKRKQRDSPVSDSTSKKPLEEAAEPPQAAEQDAEKEEFFEEMEAGFREHCPLSSSIDLTAEEQHLDEVLENLKKVPDGTEGKPPDRTGN